MTDYLYSPDIAPGDDDIAEYLNRQFSKLSDHTGQSILELSERVDLLESLIVQLVPAGYGGMNLLTPVPNFNLGAGYITVPFDNIVLAAQKGVTMDPSTDSFTPTVAGPWRFSVGLNLEGFSSSNQGRTTNLRFFNITDGVPALQTLVVGIGRNTEALDTTVAFIVDFVDLDINKAYRLEMGGGSTVTGGTLTDRLAINFVGELGLLA